MNCSSYIFTVETRDPITALKTYLTTREDLKRLEPEMLSAAQELLNEEIGLEMEELDLAATSSPSQLMIIFN